ncbi:sterigmatocystin 8-O-methyltransferase [Nemania abortiva]|nr:sterigmatocystin 8-O-methyltransferase [Nemania abortiva]
MAEQTTEPRVAQLAKIISSSVSKLQDILTAQNAPLPSFDENAPFELPKEASEVQDAIVDATAELHDLLLDPVTLLLFNGGHTNMVCLQAITRFKIASMVPENGQVSYEALAEKTCMSEPVLRRLLQYAMMMRVFREPEPGMVAHTKISRALVNPQMNDWMSSGAEDGWPSASKMVDALEKWPKSQEANETGFALANNTSEDIYTILAKDPVRAQRFANSMAATTSKPEYDAIHAVRNYDWASLGNATIVDVGGAQGHIAIELLKHFDNLNIIVQDMQATVDGAKETVKLPENLQGRLSFQGHDFFQPQTVEADAYFLRWILHNWSDKHAVKILRSLIPALKPGSRIITMDPCMPERGAIPLWKERIARMGDITMGAILNARERTQGEWKTLFADADPRFELKEIIQPADSAFALLDIRWNGS